ncbi:MAG TPA: hypothetical protein VMT34_11225 [Aggregatilineales bacterium]|nr:hypothetical protein [Aggregatilineales bacterium]
MMGRTVQRILLGAALALMIGHLVVFVVYTVSLVKFPFDYDQGEGFELNDTVLFSQGQWPYRDNAVYPFYASNYPPLYHVLLVPFVWLFGPAYWYGRLFGFAASLITAGAIAWAVQRETRHQLAALIAGLAYLASNYVYHIGPLFRQHISMVMFETLGIVVIASLSDTDPPGKRRRTLIIGLLLLLAAGYTKQLAIVSMAAAFVFLLLRGVRRAFLWGAIFAAVGGAIFLLINVSTHGQWWLNIITANVNQYIMSQFVGLLRQFTGVHGALLILAALMVIYELYFDRLSIYAIWFAAAGVDGVLAGKWGAGDSYFTTMIAAMCILAGIFVGRTLNGSWRFPAWIADRFKLGTFATAPSRVLVCLPFLLYGLAVIHLPLDVPAFAAIASVLNLHSNRLSNNMYDSAGWTPGYATIGQTPTQTDIDNGWKIVAAVRDTPGPLLSEEAAFSFRAGKKEVVTNPTQLLNLYQNGHYDPSALVKMLQDRAFGAVIFRAQFYPPPVLDAVKDAYQPAEMIPMNGYTYTIWLPSAP